MIGAVISPCIVFAFFVSNICLLLRTTGREKLSIFLKDVAGITILFFLCTGIAKGENASLALKATPEANYQTVYDTYKQEIFAQAEEQAARQVAKYIQQKFGIEPLKCIVKIDAETLDLKKIYICFKKTASLSGYALKKSISEEYGREVEVILDV